ncbi:MAG: hypothetical protein JWM68_2304 [Verrucomicrobiales bacterium]|nr:hypothetical protein [Verrucomicrobiales bacterium]
MKLYVLMKKNSSKNQQPETARPKSSKIGLALIFALVAILVVVMTKTPEAPTPIASKPAVTTAPAHVAEMPVAPEIIDTTPPQDKDVMEIVSHYPKLLPKPMELKQKVLVSKKWNSGADSFGLDKPADGQEGDTIAPASVLCVKDTIYVLDNVHNRVIGYDKEGNVVSTAQLPSGGLAVDLVLNPTDSSLFVIDQYQDKIHIVKGNEVTTLDAVPLRESLVVGARFGYDAATGTLWAQDMENGGEVAVLRDGKIVSPDARNQQMFSGASAVSQGESILLTLKTGEVLNIPFDTRVACVEQTETDANGIVWVMFTLDGDYHMRRVARIDPIQNTANVAALDIWFAFDGIRHMSSREKGLVFFVGAEQEGRVVSYDYAGAAL